MKTNPFYQMYIGERVSAKEYVVVFSDVLVAHAEPIFTTGNAVVTGVQGSGKSMLLALLKPSVRLGYHEADLEFPVHEARRNFICSNINLTQGQAIDFGHRELIDEDPDLIQSYFGDMVNFMVVRGLLHSIGQYARGPDEIRNEVGLETSNLDEIADCLTKLPVWEGWLESNLGIDALQNKMDSRIRSYQRFAHHRLKKLPEEFFETATAIGRPIADCADALKKFGLIKADTNIFVNVDQYEELGNISFRKSAGAGVDYRAVINRALSSRDTNVSYRIGTRGHAWRRHAKVMGSEARLEEERDYKYVDLDLLLKRSEHSKNDIFPRFARDVFERRLTLAGYNLESGRGPGTDALERVYGKTGDAKEKVNKITTRNRADILDFDDDWRPETINALKRIARKDLLSAKMGEIWIRQKGDIYDLDVPILKLPWQLKKYWLKERREALVIQIASRLQQRPLYYGWRDVLGLSGGSILVFLNLNQHIWDTHIQTKGSSSLVGVNPPEISQLDQTIGVESTTGYWLKKVAHETGRSAERLKFVRHLAVFLAQKLHSDKRMSYPGATGFSLGSEELEEHTDLENFLQELADYGNLLMFDHTTKEGNRKERVKFYFHPIFCPRFGLPYIRTKEPYYAKLIEVAEWVQNSGVHVKLGKQSLVKTGDLFPK